MTKHLTIKEKLNAEKELEKNINRIKELRNEIHEINKRNRRLRNHLYSRKRSKHNSMYGIDGVCYKLFRKKACELSVEERRKYDNCTKAIRTKKAKEKKDEN